ncbi:peptidoglycan-binding domain-containing protein [Guptibacillus hwajinpoensis]|uniref:Peptidoglycan binding-like domain-containing protein n=1 Tax=Guptibacillus hwajinpoensis TaxID=208199 RepID=A0ABU0JZF1_9BACL|nr:peptidoglycan-binding domain-containing protein [Alkalihalobacillus hemicentroti]MDQ0482479.1 hypothetical protein [Alkalihalobacillus hemicentroti]
MIQASASKTMKISLVFIMVFSFLLPGIADAANGEKDSTKTHTTTSDSSKKEKDKKGDGDGEVSAQYIPGNFWIKMFSSVGKAIRKTASYAVQTESYNLARDIITGRWEDIGVDDGNCSQAKVNDHTFNHKDPANWVGDGRTNSYTRVYDLQFYLIEGGFDTGAADGKWGPNTKSGVIQYQKYVGLAADGTVGPKTWANIGGGDRCN